MKLPQFIWQLIGKKIINEVGVEKWELSKTKITAIIASVLGAIQYIGPAFGHPVEIPQWVFQFLAGLGLWSLKDGMTPPTK